MVAGLVSAEVPKVSVDSDRGRVHQLHVRFCAQLENTMTEKFNGADHRITFWCTLGLAIFGGTFVYGWLTGPHGPCRADLADGVTITWPRPASGACVADDVLGRLANVRK